MRIGVKWWYCHCRFVDYGEAISIMNNVWEYDNVWLCCAMLCGITYIIVKLLWEMIMWWIKNDYWKVNDVYYMNSASHLIWYRLKYAMMKMLNIDWMWCGY